MSRVANRIINALSIPSGDVYEIGPNVVAVNPVWHTAIQQWVDEHGQKWYSNWFKKGYLATKVRVGTPENQYVWCIHRGNVSSVPATLAEQCVRFTPMSLGTEWTNAIYTGRAQGVILASAAGRLAHSDMYDVSVPPEQIAVTSVQKRFVGLPFGAEVDIRLPMKPANIVSSGGEDAGSYVVTGTLTPAQLPPPVS